MFGVRTVLSRDTTVDTRCLMGLCSVVCYLLGATAPLGAWSYRACSVNSVCTATESTMGTVHAEKRLCRRHPAPPAPRGAAARNRGLVLPAGYGSVPIVFPDAFGSASHASGGGRCDTGATQIRAAGTLGASWNPRWFQRTIWYHLVPQPSGSPPGITWYHMVPLPHGFFRQNTKKTVFTI